MEPMISVPSSCLVSHTFFSYVCVLDYKIKEKYIYIYMIITIVIRRIMHKRTAMKESLPFRYHIDEPPKIVFSQGRLARIHKRFPLLWQSS